MKIVLAFIIICLGISSNCNAQFISDDDKLHLGAGALISGATYTYVYTKTKNKKKAFWMSLGMSTLAGLTKEVYDSTKKGNKFDTGELIATTTGGLIASFTLDIFVGKKKRKSTLPSNQQ
jgi:uncharacterized protein YfiM (DUF2279 family)